MNRKGKENLAFYWWQGRLGPALARRAALPQLPFCIEVLPCKFLTRKSETLAKLSMDKKLFLNYFVTAKEEESVKHV